MQTDRHRTNKDLFRPGTALRRLRLWPLACLLAVAACAFRPPDDIHPLEDLVISDGAGIYPYKDVIRAPFSTIAERDILNVPTVSIPLSDLPDDIAWLARYDFDASGQLSGREITHGLLVQAAIWRSGRNFAPDSLWVFPEKWHGLAPLSTAAPVRGLVLDKQDQQLVRDVILDAARLDGRIGAMMDQVTELVVASGS